MGNTCVPQSPPDSSKLQQSKKHLQKSMSTKQQQMQTQILISQLHSVLSSQQIQHQHKHPQLTKKLQPNAEHKVTAIAQHLRNNLKLPIQNMKIQAIRQNIIVSSHIVAETPFHKQYQKLSKNQLNQLGAYIQKQNNIHALDCCVKFVDKMFLDFGFTVYSTSDGLFKAFVQRFIDFGSDQTRQQITQILIEMMLDNKKLLKLANNPYYFIEFWLYMINQQTQLDRQLYWIQSVKKLYASDKIAEDYLFYDNDFKVFVDLLVRVIYQCPDGKTLRTPLECYLVLSCTKRMHPHALRLEDIKNYIGQINGQTLGVSDLFKQIQGLH